MNRTCINCGMPVVRNPDSKKKRWVHEIGGKKCNYWPGGSSDLAEPAPIVISDDVTMLLIGPRVWYREDVFYENGEPNTWIDLRQGGPRKTTTQLIEDTLENNGAVWALKVAERIA